MCVSDPALVATVKIHPEYVIPANPISRFQPAVYKSRLPYRPDVILLIAIFPCLILEGRQERPTQNLTLARATFNSAGAQEALLEISMSPCWKSWRGIVSTEEHRMGISSRFGIQERYVFCVSYQSHKYSSIRRCCSRFLVPIVSIRSSLCIPELKIVSYVQRVLVKTL